MRSPEYSSSITINTSSGKKFLCLLLPALLLTATLAFAGKEFWETKPYDEWNAKDCQKMLTNSPWAKELNLTGVGGGGSESTDSQAPFVKYTVQLRNAQPIRQAIVRQQQIIRKYDSLPPEQKQALDRSFQSFLTGVPSDVVIVSFSFDTNNRGSLRTLLTHWQTQTTDMLKNSFYLSGSKGEKVPIKQFIPVEGAAQEFQAVFPRQVNGKEILLPEDKTLRLEFSYPVVGGLGDGRGFIEFKTDKMKINDEVVY